MIKNADGFLEKITLKGKDYKFNSKGPALYGLDKDGIEGKLDFAEYEDYAVITAEITNTGDEDFSPRRLGVYLGVDTYMDSYPSWNEKLFPTMLRFEKTHFYGYFMSPMGDILGIASDMPFASYEIFYNKSRHRVETVKLDILSSLPQPKRYPDNLKVLRGGEKTVRKIYLFPLDSLDELYVKAECFTGSAIAVPDKFTYEIGEKMRIGSGDGGKISITAPSGKKICAGEPFEEYGLYTIDAEKNGKISQTYVYCRKPWSFYLQSAGSEAIKKEQKATTHCESWYGLFSAFLAAKHYQNAALKKAAEDKFSEIMPYMFDLEKGEPKLLPGRIQNTSSAISLLTDRFAVSDEEDFSSLDAACRLADFLLTYQREDGAFYGGYTEEGEHYSCVIYIVKSLLELYLELKKFPQYRGRAEKYYASVKKAIDNLVLQLDDIGTEGEQTFEDGMISCSALQIGMFALNLPQEERAPYIKAAVCLIEKHACLEQNKIPDCRMRGGSLRFWESQFDVLTKPNMVSSPHGWTGWTLYAKYYIYLLTGKEKYLTGLMDGMGAGAQLIDTDGNLRWAFVCDPCIEAKMFVKDKKLENGYSGKVEDCVIGERYLDMISGWYKHEKQRVTGGFLTHPLMTKDGSFEVDNQGGCCDNDVHEIFKCMEETVLKKAFIHEKENGEFLLYGCCEKDGVFFLDDDVEVVVSKTSKDICVVKRGIKIEVSQSALPCLTSVQ